MRNQILEAWDNNCIELTGDGCKKVYKTIVEYAKYFNKISECTSFNIYEGSIEMRNKKCVPEYVTGQLSFNITKKKLNKKDNEQIDAMGRFLKRARVTVDIEPLITWDKAYGKQIENIFIGYDYGITFLSSEGEILQLGLTMLENGVFGNLEFIKEEPIEDLSYDIISKGYDLHKVKIDDYFVNIYRNAIVHVKKGFEPSKKSLYKPNNYNGDEIRVISIEIQGPDVFLENYYTIVKVNEDL